MKTLKFKLSEDRTFSYCTVGDHQLRMLRNNGKTVRSVKYYLALYTLDGTFVKSDWFMTLNEAKKAADQFLD